MIKEIRFAFIIDYAGMGSKTVRYILLDDPFVFPRTSWILRHAIFNHFWFCSSARIYQVIQSFAFINPGSFYIMKRLESSNRAIQFNHIFFQLYPFAATIAPEQISLPIIVNKYCWINIIPAIFHISGHFIYRKCLADSINKWTGWPVRNCYAYGSSSITDTIFFMKRRHKPVEFTVSFNKLTGIF